MLILWKSDILTVEKNIPKSGSPPKRSPRVSLHYLFVVSPDPLPPTSTSSAITDSLSMSAGRSASLVETEETPQKI